MARKERIWYPGAVYHIMIRGIRRSDIFKDEGDYGVYLEILEVVMRRYPFILYSYTGSLYDGRYKSEIIDNDKYNLQVSRYIHLNPVKANMVDEPLEYIWSSYNAYLDADSDRIIDDDKILSYFKDKSRALYMSYVENIEINLLVDKEIKVKMEDD